MSKAKLYSILGGNNNERVGVFDLKKFRLHQKYERGFTTKGYGRTHVVSIFLDVQYFSITFFPCRCVR